MRQKIGKIFLVQNLRKTERLPKSRKNKKNVFKSRERMQKDKN